MRTDVLCAGMALVGTLVASSLYRDGVTPARTAASEAVSAVGAPLDSRTVQSADSARIAFDSDEAHGLMIIIR